jgi:NAD(P)-dependent dehydrogenase (short-subunit alcohol dehydrogenase family)
MNVNFVSPFVLVQRALPLLRAAAESDLEGGAKVIALASVAGVHAESGLAAYGASKAALISLMEALNVEESSRGVNATAIAPGFVNTDMSAWVTDVVSADTMIQIADVVEVVNMLLQLSRTACITKIVMSRSGTSGYVA